MEQQRQQKRIKNQQLWRLQKKTGGDEEGRDAGFDAHAPHLIFIFTKEQKMVATQQQQKNEAVPVVPHRRIRPKKSDKARKADNTTLWTATRMETTATTTTAAEPTKTAVGRRPRTQQNCSRQQQRQQRRRQRLKTQGVQGHDNNRGRQQHEKRESRGKRNSKIRFLRAFASAVTPTHSYTLIVRA